MKYSFHPEALQEYKNTAKYYLKISSKLAKAFINEIEKSIDQIINIPETSPIIHEDIRRFFLHRFPFGIYYSIEKNNTILIIAIMHMSRKPGYWKTRLY